MITHKQARESLQRFIDGAFNNGDSPRFSIPARPDKDDDLVLSTFIDDAFAELAARDKRIAELEAIVAEMAEGLYEISTNHDGLHPRYATLYKRTRALLRRKP